MDRRLLLRHLDALNLFEFLDAALYLLRLGRLIAETVDEGFERLDAGPGTAEDSFYTAVHGTFLREAGFTLTLLEQTMAQVLPLAHARLGDKLTHGVVNF